MNSFFFVFLSVFFFGCKNDNQKFQNDFNTCLKIVQDYNVYTGEMNDTILGQFYFANEYLVTFTGIESKYICADIPYYLSENDCLDNVIEWKRWYFENHQLVTNSKSDSVIKIIVNKKIWWQDSTIIDIVF
jgi:hypothetical protein